jgi:hypothetical protein
MYKKVFSILIFLGFSIDIIAYPISPRPLRKLVMESEYIIVGFVSKIYDKKKEKNNWDTKVAKIEILERLQGNIKENTIEISFNPNMICPSPDQYYDSTFVISFLNKIDGKYYTCALSYGAKTLKQNEIEIYKQRILEIQSLLKIKDKNKQYQEIVEWLVKCAENETTRWEGVFELSPESGFMSYYSEDKIEGYKDVLSKTQNERLKIALLNTETISYNDFGLVDLVYIGNEKQIDEFLLKGLRALTEDDYWLAGSYFNRLKHKNNSIDMKTIIEEYDKIMFEYDNIDEIKKLIDRFIKLIE